MVTAACIFDTQQVYLWPSKKKRPTKGQSESQNDPLPERPKGCRAITDVLINWNPMTSGSAQMLIPCRIGQALEQLAELVLIEQSVEISFPTLNSPTIRQS